MRAAERKDNRMPEYVIFADNERRSRRTIADAIDVLATAANFKTHDRAEIRIGLLRLPSTVIVGLVQLEFLPMPERVCVVRLQGSDKFNAILSGDTKPTTFKIDRLNGASVDGMGNVILTDGIALRCVEVDPVYLPLRPTELDWRIVHHTVSIIGAEDRCYRRVRDDLPAEYREMIDDIKVLDCSRLVGLKLSPLKVIALDIRERDPSLKMLSDQQIANSLRRFGMRIPSARPRRNARPVSAPI